MTVATAPDTRPRVFNAMPSRNHPGPAASHYALPTRGRTEIIPGMGMSSLLCYNFNSLWATALNWGRAGILEYFLLHHDDVEVRTHGWLDILIDEMRRTGAAVLSAVIPIKDDSGLTSIAVETDNEWAPIKLGLQDCWNLPPTFCAADLPAAYAGRRLLVNTGLMLIDLSRPEFYRADADGNLPIFFTIDDSLGVKPDGDYAARVKPEDWNFSRMCDRAGLPVYATTKVQILHHGNNAWANYRPDEAETSGEIQGWFDFADLYREVVKRTPDGGRMVEVGCWKGKSLAFLLSEAKKSGKQLYVTGIDHFQGSPGQDLMLKEAGREDIEAECRKNLNRTGYPCKLIARPSAEAVTEFSDGSLDFVFLDGDHSFAAVTEDIRAWRPKLRPGGVLAGHDYDESGVYAAVTELLPDAQQFGRCWWWETPGG